MRRNILIASTIACTFIVALLTPSVYSVPPGTDDQIRDRLAPLGSVTRAAAVLQSAVDVSAEPLSGEAVYDQFCSVCHTAGVAGAPKFADNARAIFGGATNGDFGIYHDTNHSYLQRIPGGTGDIYVKLGGDDAIIAKTDNSVELYWDNAKKLETDSAGVKITGVCTATSFSGDGSGFDGLNNSQLLDSGDAVRAAGGKKQNCASQ